MELKAPIFIIGAGRSGSTIFHTVFSEHPNVAWFSDLCEKYPDNPSLNRVLMHWVDLPIFESYLRKKFPPGEYYNFWNDLYKGFSRPFRDLVSDDVTAKTKLKFRRAFSNIITKRKNQLIAKVTGWPRVGFLREIFNDAKFIHVIRDGRAVVNSILNVDWWQGWGGPQNWRWGELSPSYKSEWEKANQSFIVLAGLQWKTLILAVEKSKKIVGEENFFEIKYESFCTDPISVFKKVGEFSCLEWSQKFEKKIKEYDLKNTNDKWQKELTEYQKDELGHVLGEVLDRYDYI